MFGRIQQMQPKDGTLSKPFLSDCRKIGLLMIALVECTDGFPSCRPSLAGEAKHSPALLLLFHHSSNQQAVSSPRVKAERIAHHAAGPELLCRQCTLLRHIYIKPFDHLVWWLLGSLGLIHTSSDTLSSFRLLR
jgi:hypothetical protein